ncbi:MAG: hypothetical protein Q9211_001963 [Gyalolechia sp. 1 TL-2023]
MFSRLPPWQHNKGLQASDIQYKRAAVISNPEREKVRRDIGSRRASKALKKGSSNASPPHPIAHSDTSAHLFPLDIVRGLLYAHGDDPDPLPETVRVLDEIVTDIIIETCHAASRHATLNNRQKVKLEDFKFVVSKDERLLGRMIELIGMEKELKKARKVFDTDEGKVGLERGGPGRKRKRATKEKGEDAEDMGEADDGMEDTMFGAFTSFAE